MAADKLTLYNDALLLLGQRFLSAVDEDREPRYLLDHAYDAGASDYCLQLVKPRFATVTTKLNSPSTSSVHDLDSVHALPADFLEVVGVYSDSKLDQPISRYIIDGTTLACEYDTVYLRYTSNGGAITTWTPSFDKVVAAYLAQYIAIKVSPDDLGALVEHFNSTAKAAAELEGEKEPAKRSAATTVTLTDAWRHIYNDALLVLGLDEITSNTDDSNRRSKLDRTLDSDLVQDLLEDTGWNFALNSQKIDYNPSVEPEWGWPYVFDKPSDLYRLDGMYMDEYLQVPLRDYIEEGDRWFTNYDTIYVEYVSSNFLSNPNLWPAFFKRLVAARMANDAAMSLRAEGADPAYATQVYKERLSGAKGNDAVVSRPRKLAQGNWTKARRAGRNYRGRP
jgi:hypothetical protein